RDIVADGRAGDTGPDRVDGACCLETEHGVRGQRDGLEIAGPQGEIGRADAGGLDLDPYLPLTRFGQRDPGPLQHLRRSVPGHHNRARHSSSFLVVGHGSSFLMAALAWPRTATSACSLRAVPAASIAPRDDAGTSWPRSRARPAAAGCGTASAPASRRT